MNENDMDRYYWRTGQRWGADYRPPDPPPRSRYLGIPRWTIIIIFASSIVTTVMLFAMR